MGSITERKRKNGTTAYLAQITIKRGGKIVHRENDTFDRRQNALAWIARREEELSVPGALERTDDPPLRQVIERYEAESKKQLGRTKVQVLRTLKGMDIADRRCSKITSVDLIALGQELGRTRKPQTVASYFSHLAAVFAVARPAWGYPLNQQAMADTFTVGKRMGITGKSKARDRRPTRDELDKLMQHFGNVRARRPDSLPMQAIVAFAIFSTRREDEICRIEWECFDRDRILVRDLKHPGDKLGNDQWLDLPPEAVRIIEAQPRTASRIFPYTTDAVCASFTRACKFLQIEDLHFHDLRHHGISRLFEIGRTIPHVASVSGHRSWNSLKRYTHLRQTGDCMANWPWLDIVCEKKAPDEGGR